MAHPTAMLVTVLATPVVLSVLLLVAVRAVDGLGWTQGNAPPLGPDGGSARAAAAAAAEVIAATELEPVARIRLVSRLREHLLIRTDGDGTAVLRQRDGGLELVLPEPEFTAGLTALRVVEMTTGVRLGERRRVEITTWVLTLTTIANHLAAEHSPALAATVAQRTYAGVVTTLPLAARAPVLAMLRMHTAVELEPVGEEAGSPAPRRAGRLPLVVRAVAGLVAAAAGFWLAAAGFGPVVVVVGATVGGLAWLIAGDTPVWLSARVDQVLTPLARRSAFVRWASSPSSRPVLRLVTAVAFGLAVGAVVHLQLHLKMVTAAAAVVPLRLRTRPGDAVRAALSDLLAVPLGTPRSALAVDGSVLVGDAEDLVLLVDLIAWLALQRGAVIVHAASGESPRSISKASLWVI